jgi:hypothetical protein
VPSAIVGRGLEALSAQITRAAEKNKPDGLLIGCFGATEPPRQAPLPLKTILTVFYRYYISAIRTA